MCEVVLGTVPDFIDFHIHLPTFLWQLRYFVERIIRKRLSDSFTHNSAIVSANSSFVFLTTAKDYDKFSCCSSLCYCTEFPRQLILKLTSDVQDWIVLLTSDNNISLSEKPIT